MAEKKILIVDYDTKNLDLMDQLFKSYKFQVIKATDGLSAYEKFKSERPDLVILEAFIPKLHGFDLAKKISVESKGSVPIVIVTGLYRGAKFRHEALSSFGVSEYFEKPFDKNKLVNSVLHFLDKEEEIEEELPDPTSVIENLSRRLKTRTQASKKGTSS